MYVGGKMKDLQEFDVLDMYTLRKELQKLESGTEEEKDLKVVEKFKKGISIKGHLINMLPLKFFNPMWDKEYTWYYFECPKCKRRSIKIYLSKDEVFCGMCRKKRVEYVAKDTAGMIGKINYYLKRLNEEKPTSRARSKWIKIITKYYNKLDPKYQPSATIVFLDLQRWCEKAYKEEKSPDYKRAMKDVLTRMSYIKDVLIQTKMAEGL